MAKFGVMTAQEACDRRKEWVGNGYSVCVNKQNVRRSYHDIRESTAAIFLIGEPYYSNTSNDEARRRLKPSDEVIVEYCGE